MSEIDDLREELAKTQMAYEMAAQMSQFQAGFLARTAHELRSPLSSLISLHQIILSDLCESPEEQKEFVKQAYNSANKLLKIIDEVIEVAKIDYGTKKVQQEIVSISELFADLYNITHLQAANYNLQLEIIIPESNFYVRADQKRLRQVLSILIDSSISLLPQGSIKLSANPHTASQLLAINLDVECSPDYWTKTQDLPSQNFTATAKTVPASNRHPEISPEMHLLICQKLLAAMEGKLTLQALPKSGEINADTRIQCLLTLV